MEKKMVLCLTHVDLAWKKDRAEMAELFDHTLICMLDLLERYPDFTYALEQVLHYRDLHKRRPDLFERVRKYVQAGQLEFVAGLASTIETNVTCGESFVRNMQIGSKWIKKEFGITVKTCMMIDTFGFPPQMPQVLREFGFDKMFANRLGGNKAHDVFYSIGLDGSMILVLGRDTMAPHIKPGHVAFGFYLNRTHLQALFAETEKNTNEPLLVMPYSENEVVPDSYIVDFVQQNANRYQFSSLAAYVEAMDAVGTDWPLEDGDLNPEFSGTFSLRQQLRIQNRLTERLLLEAEKWSALHCTQYDQRIEECWWEMAYTQFHDIITGSHPTEIYLDCLKRFDAICATAHNVIRDAFGGEIPASNNTSANIYTIVNALPWDREEAVALRLQDGWDSVHSIFISGKPITFYIKNGYAIAKVSVPAMASVIATMYPGEEKAEQNAKAIYQLENEHLLIEFGQNYIIKRMVHKPSQTIVLENCNDLLVLQQDDGNFQIEHPISPEVPCGLGQYTINITKTHGVQCAVVTGCFPASGAALPYCLSIMLDENKPYIEIRVDVDWHIEGRRLRLNLASSLGATAHYYEVPFGVTQRTPYTRRANAMGEWPAHQFVCMESEAKQAGIALINKGVIGVEPGYGVLKTTLLRAPVTTFAGMEKDDTSSDHGNHSFEFRLFPYAGSWKKSCVIPMAQEMNTPFLVLDNVENEVNTGIRITEMNIVLSAVKATDDGKITMRLYESTGTQTTCQVVIPKLVAAWKSDLWELPSQELDCSQEVLCLTFAPFEIKTILIKRSDASFYSR